MIRWCEHNRRSDGARGPQRRPCPLARGTRCVAGPGRGGSRPVSGHALHELSCPRGCHKAHPVATLMTGGREAAGGAAHLSGREAAADTSMATCTGHWPSGRRSFRKQRTVNPLTRSGSLQLPLLFSRPALRAAACGGRPRAGNDTTVTQRPASPNAAGCRSARGPSTSGRYPTGPCTHEALASALVVRRLVRTSDASVAVPSGTISKAASSYPLTGCFPSADRTHRKDELPK